MDKTPLAIYVHWPYCARICPYCDFNVYKQRRDTGLVHAICLDLKAWRDWSGPREIISVHFGGGTPSLMQEEDIAAILAAVDDLWGLSERAEIGLEANPNNAAIDKLDGFKAGGINRLSLGVQSFHDPALKQLGRDHDANAARSAVSAAIKRFRSVSADLIFGWAGQTQTILQADLETLLSFGLPHISTYQLTIEDGTAFSKSETRGDKQAVGEDQSADFYNIVTQSLVADGFEAYEISNFAQQAHRSQHNLAYWQGHDYVGVGPGAHGRLTVEGIRYATIAAMRPEHYTDHVTLHGYGYDQKERLSREAQRDEYVMMGLRIKEGISLSRLTAIFPDENLAERAAPLIASGHLEYSGERLFVTDMGRPLLNHITEKLLVG